MWHFNAEGDLHGGEHYLSLANVAIVKLRLQEASMWQSLLADGGLALSLRSTLHSHWPTPLKTDFTRAITLCSSAASLS